MAYVCIIVPKLRHKIHGRNPVMSLGVAPDLCQCGVVINNPPKKKNKQFGGRKQICSKWWWRECLFGNWFCIGLCIGDYGLDYALDFAFCSLAGCFCCLSLHSFCVHFLFISFFMSCHFFLVSFSFHSLHFRSFPNYLSWLYQHIIIQVQIFIYSYPFINHFLNNFEHERN